MQSNAGDHVEGRLNAHRRLLVSVLSILAAQPSSRAALQNLLRENEAVSDHDEDPGVEPDEAFAIQSAANDEITAILRDAMARAAALDRQDS